MTPPRALLSPAALTRAERLGPAARQWSADLGDLVTDIEQRWAITVGDPFPNANEGLVARATTADGTEAVLKLTAPTPWTDHQFDLLEQADGRGYARVLAIDHERRAILLEALGEPLGDLGWSSGRVHQALVDTLREAWTVPLPRTADVKTGLQKSNERGWFVEHLWNELGRPCSVSVIETAKRYCERRADAFHPQRSIYGHGDPHAGNALRVPAHRPGAASGFVFVDPDGLCVERAHDLGAIMAGNESELQSGDARELAHRWCGSLADATGVDGQAIWEWAFIERVAIGLYALEQGQAWGHEKLDVAERLL